MSNKKNKFQLSYCLLLFIIHFYVSPVFGQLCDNDQAKLGPSAEPKKFININEKEGYFEIISDHATVYLVCGKKIDVPKGEVIDVYGGFYEGAYDGHSGKWAETFIDFDGVGRNQSTLVYIFLSDLKRLVKTPGKKSFNDKAYLHVDKQGYHREQIKVDPIYWGYLILFSLVTISTYIIIAIIRKKKKPVIYTPSFSPAGGPDIQASPVTNKPPDKNPIDSDKQSNPVHSSTIPESVTSINEPEDLDTIFAELDSLIGLTSVKKEVRSLANLMKVQKLKRDAGIATTMPNLHLVFTGSAGTGKTTVAQLIGRIYRQIGLLSKGHTIMVSRKDLVGEYIGHTAPKTDAVIKKAKDGLLFIDEAYSLYTKDSGKDFGQEAIATLIQAMENQRGQFAVIMAGYAPDMAVLLNSNQGLKSRLSNFIDFPDYTVDELGLIFKKICTERQHIIGDGVLEKAKVELKKSKEYFKENFGNAREVRTLVERIEKNQSDRLTQIEGLEKMPKQVQMQLLRTILPEDIKQEIYPTGGKSQRIGF